MLRQNRAFFVSFFGALLYFMLVLYFLTYLCSNFTNASMHPSTFLLHTTSSCVVPPQGDLAVTADSALNVSRASLVHYARHKLAEALEMGAPDEVIRVTRGPLGLSA
jgi:hypothetical protein